MNELKDLYQELILDHGQRPRNFVGLESASHEKEGFNPLCGDRITVYLLIENDVIKQATFQGAGCAISTASASLMTETLRGKTLAEAQQIFQDFHNMVTGKAEAENLGKLTVLKGVSAFPMRVKCATLCWHTLMAATSNPKVVIA